MKLPQVKIEILGPIIEEIVDPHWVDNMLTKFVIEQPVLAEYLAEQETDVARLVGLLVFRFLESQCDADELKELIG